MAYTAVRYGPMTVDNLDMQVFQAIAANRTLIKQIVVANRSAASGWISVGVSTDTDLTEVEALFWSLPVPVGGTLVFDTTMHMSAGERLLALADADDRMTITVMAATEPIA